MTEAARMLGDTTRKAAGAASATISMDKKTRDFLARKKKAMRARERRQLT